MLIGKFANLLIFLRPTHLLMLTLANLLIFFACSKSDEPEVPTKIETPEHLSDWTPQPKVDVAQPYMAFATGSTSATTLSLTAVGATVTATDVWVDTNNNGVFDEGTDVKVTDFSKPVSFTATSGLFTVYGAVKELTATGNVLTAADLRKNEALTKLNVANNQLSEKALLDLVKSLPTATSAAEVVLRKATDDGNTVTEAVLIAAKERGWQALKIEGGKEVEDLPADTQAPKAGAITEATATAFNTVLVKWTAAADNKTAAAKLRYQVLYNVQGSGEVKTSELTENTLELTLTGLTEKTTYMVKVKVIDEAGNAAEYEAKEVTTGAAPADADKEAPKVGAITEATATFNSLSLKWTAGTDNKTAAEKLRYQVVYQVKGSGEVKTSELKENRLELTLTGLPEKTTYIVKVKVLDEANNATEYEAKEVTTDAAPEEEDKEAPKAGTVTEATAIAHDKISLKWTAGTDNQTPEKELEYELSFYNMSTGEYKSSGSLIGVTSYEFKATPNTEYTILLSVSDKAGNSTDYETQIVTTPAAPGEDDKEAPKVGTITKAEASIFNTIFVKWTPATDNKTAAEKLRYQVLYQVKGSRVVNTTQLKENELSHTLTYLNKNTTYIIKVRVIDEAGNTAEYEAKEVMVVSVEFSDKESPKVGTITKAKAGAFNTIFVEWTAATDNITPQEKLRYQVVYNIKGSSDEKTTELTENKLSHILAFLKKNKTYIIKVRVVDKAGNTAEYAPKEVTVGKIPGPNGDLLDVSYFIKLTTNRPIGEKTEIRVDATEEDREGVWIDSNNNGEWDEDIDLIPRRFGDYIPYTVKNKTFTIYGKTSKFYHWSDKISDVKLYNPKLKELLLYDNELTSLTIPSSDALKIVNLNNNPLTSLQIGDVPNLEYLNVRGTELTSLDISAYPKLKELRAGGTPLTSLDASKNPLLKEVEVFYHKGKGLNGKPLEDFLRSLPDGEGVIYLNNKQRTPTVMGILKEKGWKVSFN